MKKLFLLSVIAFFGMLVVNAQDSTLAEYAGKYKFPPGSAVPETDVIYSGGGLSIVSAMGSATLARVSSDTFSLVEYNGLAIFARNADKKIVSVRISVAGMDLEGTKDGAMLRGLKRFHPLMLRNWPAFTDEMIPDANDDKQQFE